MYIILSLYIIFKTTIYIYIYIYIYNIYIYIYNNFTKNSILKYRGLDTRSVSCRDLRQSYSSTVYKSFQALFKKQYSLGSTKSLPLLRLIYWSPGVADLKSSHNVLLKDLFSNDHLSIIFSFLFHIFCLLALSCINMTHIAFIMHNITCILELIV